MMRLTLKNSEAIWFHFDSIRYPIIKSGPEGRRAGKSSDLSERTALLQKNESRLSFFVQKLVLTIPISHPRLFKTASLDAFLMAML